MRVHDFFKLLISKSKAMKKITPILLLFGLMIGFTYCSKDENATLKVYLTDAPADFENVMIDIRSIEVHIGNNDNEDGWRTLQNFTPVVFNLLNFSSGLDTLLGSIDLPASEISQIRLVLGDNNSVKLNGIILPLTTPSAYSSGLKIDLKVDLKEGNTYKTWVDFDAGKSIVITGNNQYILKPIIRAFDNPNSGVIWGYVSPAKAKSYVLAIANNDTLGTFTNTKGFFIFNGIPTGIYKIVIKPINGYQEKIVDNVSISLGEGRDLGRIDMTTGMNK